MYNLLYMYILVWQRWSWAIKPAYTHHISWPIGIVLCFTKSFTCIYYRVKHNNGSICKSLLLCGIIPYFLLSYIGKLYINPCLNGRAMLSQNFNIIAQTIFEIWHKMYPKNGPFCALCCCTWNFTLFLNYVTHVINWNLSFECIYWLQKLLKSILMFSLLELIKNCGSYDQICKCGCSLCKLNFEFLPFVMGQ